MGSQIKCPDCGHLNHAGEEDCSSCHAPISSFNTPQPKAGMQRRILTGTISDLGPRPAATVKAGLTVAEAVKKMRELKVGCVLVLHGDELAGIFTERDLLVSVPSTRKLTSMPVAEAMRPRPEALTVDRPVAHAFHQMMVNGQHHMPVRLKDGSLAVVSARDLLRYLCR